MIDYSYYKIIVSYEVSHDVLKSEDPEVVKAREILLDSLRTAIPEDKYEKFHGKLYSELLEDTLDYVFSYECLIRTPTNGHPMVEYSNAESIRDKIREEIEEFFDSVDCDYKKINIKTLL